MEFASSLNGCKLFLVLNLLLTMTPTIFFLKSCSWFLRNPSDTNRTFVAFSATDLTLSGLGLSKSFSLGGTGPATNWTLAFVATSAQLGSANTFALALLLVVGEVKFNVTVISALLPDATACKTPSPSTFTALGSLVL